ncbi:MAG TPA: hypothetical protein VGI40_10665 [Pirellulaceae bacterium]|jgi:hypothetical protein
MSRTVFLLAIAVCSLLRLGLAAEGTPSPVESATPTALDPIAATIQQLEHDTFSERQAASKILTEAGAAALPHLENTAASGNREAAGRALDIVKRHFQNGDAELKSGAREILTRLAKNDNVATAQRARNVLDPPRTSMLPIGAMPNARGLPFIPPQQVTRTQMTTEINGRREIEVRENGRKTKIQTLPDGRIQFEFTEPLNGRDVTRKIDAKDLSELKRKDAEAGQLYELYDAAPRPPRPSVRTSSTKRG